MCLGRRVPRAVRHGQKGERSTAEESFKSAAWRSEDAKAKLLYSDTILPHLPSTMPFRASFLVTNSLGLRRSPSVYSNLKPVKTDYIYLRSKSGSECSHISIDSVSRLEQLNVG